MDNLLVVGQAPSCRYCMEISVDKGERGISKETASDRKETGQKTGGNSWQSPFEETKQTCKNKNYKIVFAILGTGKLNLILTNINRLVQEYICVCIRNKKKVGFTHQCS